MKRGEQCRGRPQLERETARGDSVPFGRLVRLGCAPRGPPTLPHWALQPCLSRICLPHGHGQSPRPGQQLSLSPMTTYRSPRTTGPAPVTSSSCRQLPAAPCPQPQSQRLLLEPPSGRSLPKSHRQPGSQLQVLDSRRHSLLTGSPHLSAEQPPSGAQPGGPTSPQSPAGPRPTGELVNQRGPVPLGHSPPIHGCKRGALPPSGGRRGLTSSVRSQRPYSSETEGGSKWTQFPGKKLS